MTMIQKFLFSFNSLTTKSIEIIIILLSSFGSIITIAGIAVIPWGYTSKTMEVLYIITLVLFIYSLGIPIFISFLFKKNININNINFYIINSFIIILCSILSILLTIIIAIGAILDLKKKHKIENIQMNEKTDEFQKMITKEKNLVSNGELAYTFFSIIVNLILWIALLLFWITEYFRLKYKIEGTYNVYVKKNISKVSIENSKESEGNVVGHDKYGFPLYMEKFEKIPKNIKSNTEFNYRPFNKYNYNNKNDIDSKNILRYSYKGKFNGKYNENKDYKSVDVIHKLKEEKKEKYIEKYTEGVVNPYYSNFENKSALNMSNINNSINPGK